MKNYYLQEFLAQLLHNNGIGSIGVILVLVMYSPNIVMQMKMTLPQLVPELSQKIFMRRKK